MAKKSKAKLESASADSAEPSPFSRTVVFARRPSTSGSMTRGHLVLDCGPSIEWGGGGGGISGSHPRRVHDVQPRRKAHSRAGSAEAIGKLRRAADERAEHALETNR
jgi:hypothetical protein